MQVYDAVRKEFQLRGAYFLSEEEKVKVRAKVIVDGKLNPNIVGQSVQKLAELFGITVPAGSKVIIGEVEGIGKHEPLSEVGEGQCAWAWKSCVPELCFSVVLQPSQQCRSGMRAAYASSLPPVMLQPSQQSSCSHRPAAI